MKDEEGSLSEFWASVCRQTVAPSEIVFVDAGSSDGSASTLDQIKAQDSRVRVAAASGAYPGTARNVGIEAASTQMVALADCGTVLSPTWLEELLRAFKAEEGREVAYGSFEPIHDRPAAAWGTIAFLPPLSQRDGGLPRGETLSSLLVTKELWNRAGRFPPWRAAEDLEFLDRLRRSSAQGALAPKAIAYWRAPGSVGETFRRLSVYSRHNTWAGQQWRWHYGIARVYRASIGAGILASVATGWRPSRAIGACFLASFAARTADRLWRARRTDPPLRAVRTGDALGVALMILVGDAATVFGWVTAWTRDRPSAYR